MTIRPAILSDIPQMQDIIAVLDIDSENLNTFDDVDRHYLEELVKYFEL